MASEEHKELAYLIKSVHEDLRKSAQIVGPSKAWENHLKNRTTLKTYAENMKTLADIWERNAGGNESNAGAKSRITWIINYCMSYFFTSKLYLEKRAKEERILKIDFSNTINENHHKNILENYEHLYLKEDLQNINVLDVGSCFNPLAKVDNFNVIALDISPFDQSVYKGDFLNIKINDEIGITPTIGNEILSLPRNYFDCVVFSLLLEYLPSSEQRIKCCEKAYDVLKYEGILIVITPDSQHVGKNAQLMKNWRYTLGMIGFTRIKFEKLTHITCLVYRKTLAKKIAEQWSNIHKEEYMTFSIDIPQDQNT